MKRLYRWLKIKWLLSRQNSRIPPWDEILAEFPKVERRAEEAIKRMAEIDCGDGRE